MAAKQYQLFGSGSGFHEYGSATGYRKPLPTTYQLSSDRIEDRLVVLNNSKAELKQ
jgi:hypothetical protein